MGSMFSMENLQYLLPYFRKLLSKTKEDVAKHVIHRSFVQKESETLEVSGDLFTLQHIIKTP